MDRHTDIHTDEVLTDRGEVGGTDGRRDRAAGRFELFRDLRLRLLISSHQFPPRSSYLIISSDHLICFISSRHFPSDHLILFHFISSFADPIIASDHHLILF